MRQLLVLTLLSIDTLQTAYAVATIGPSIEANPVARWMFTLPMGFATLFVVRLLSLVGIVRLANRYPKLRGALTLCLVILTLTVINNFIALA